QPSRHELPVAVSPYCDDPDSLTDIAADLLSRVNQDMFPTLRNPARIGLRARMQSAAFARCLEQIERASRTMDEAQRRQLFERFGYPADFLRLTSEICAELYAAVEAKDADDWPCALRHAKAAIALGHERDALDARYNSGKWAHWYDRDLKYPCRSVMESLERELAHLC
ncbi:MAG: hypothetical protein IKJ89_00805, partial [Kiritimatiellae bacterium]|nr:hypothetical protein [Kiritimatiellia bacterium]